MQGTVSTQGMRSIISTVSISPEGFLPSILLLVVIIVTVVIVSVILVVVVVAIVGVVIVVAIIRVVVVAGVSAIIKLSFVIIGQAYAFHQDKASSVRAILIGHEPFQFSPGDSVSLLYSNRLDVCILPRQGIIGQGSSGTGLLPSGRVDITGDENPTDEDGDIEIGDSTEVSVSFGDEIFSKGLGKMFPGEAGK
ncbi:hypothetical protein Tco_0950730 [Tanacetum coccineum]